MNSFIENALPGIVADFFSSQTKMVPVTMKFEIPSNHPQAAKIRALAQRLACESELPSGVRVKKLAVPGAADEFLEALKPVVGSDVVDEAKERLRPVPKIPNMPSPDVLVQLLRRVSKPQ